MSMTVYLRTFEALFGGGSRPSEGQRLISNASLLALVNEYNLVLKKESRLSRAQRDAVQHRVKSLAQKGKVFLTQSGEASLSVAVLP